MSAGYSAKPLFQKLGLKSGMTMAVIDPPPNYWDWLRELPDDVSIRDLNEGPVDFIHVFVKEKAALEGRLEALRNQMAQAGMIWVSWPKKTSKVPTDLTEDVIRELALQASLVDTKVAAIDETWSGLKLVIRLKDRK